MMQPLRNSLPKIQVAFLVLLSLLGSFQIGYSQDAAPSTKASSSSQPILDTSVDGLVQLDAYIEQSRQAWQVPGLAVAVVRGNDLLLSKGYGVRRVGDEAKVDQHTLFAIASNSKAFTAACLAMLVEDGKLNWDDRVQKYLPWLELHETYASHDLRVRDLLCHRSGLGTFSGDLLWYGTPYSPREILERARYLKPEGLSALTMVTRT